MTLIRFKNQTEYAFIVWVSGAPESRHALDMQRFYSFVKCVARYRSKKWRNYEYFKERIHENKPHFLEEHIDYFWELMCKCLEFHKTPYIDSMVVSDGKYGYSQVGVKNGEIYEIAISEKEFISKGRKV